MAAIDVLYGESGWVRLIPLTCPATEFTALGTAVDFVNAVKATPTFVAPATATTDTTYHTTAAANGNEISITDTSKTYECASGNEVTTAGDTTKESIEFSVTATGAQYDSLVDEFRAGRPVFAICEFGKVPSTGVPYEFLYIFGNISALTVNSQAGPNTYDFTITAATFGVGQDYTRSGSTAYTDFNAAYTGGSGNEITPLNDGTQRTITDLASDTDYGTTMGGGYILRKLNV